MTLSSLWCTVMGPMFSLQKMSMMNAVNTCRLENGKVPQEESSGLAGAIINA